MLFLDITALIKRYDEEDGTALVLQRMDHEPEWVVCAVARPKVEKLDLVVEGA